LPATPLPVTAALTSLGVWKCTSMPRRAAARAITPPACAVPITVDTFCWENTRSIAMTSGRCVSIQCSAVSLIAEQPPVQRHVGGRAHHVDVEGHHVPAGTLDQRQPTTRQPRVDSHDTHAASVIYEQLFDKTLTLDPTSTRNDTPTHCGADAGYAVPARLPPLPGRTRRFVGRTCPNRAPTPAGIVKLSNQTRI
jgi:hypothetical protein